MTAAARGWACLFVKRRFGRPSIGLLSIVTTRLNFPASPRDQAGEDSDVDALRKEVHRAIDKYGVSAAGMETVELAVVGAIHGARPQVGRAVSRLALEDDPAFEVIPGTAIEYLILSACAGEPAPGPAGVFGKQDRI